MVIVAEDVGVPVDATGTVAPMPVVLDTRTAPAPGDVGTALSSCRHGRYDPTTRLVRTGAAASSTGEFVRAARTVDGPGTVHVRWQHGDSITVLGAWGPGADRLRDQVPTMAGSEDRGAPELLTAPHPVIAAAAQAHRHVRLGRTGDPYAELLPTIIEQRITAGEALRQWAGLCRLLGDAAPGPFEGLLLPPAPDVLATTPYWRLHRLGIERKRAAALIEVARHADKIARWAELTASDAGTRLALLRGVGAWTIGNVLRVAWGDPDAVAVGDYHHKNTVAWSLAGEPRGSDERMMELLEPYRGQRGRVVQLLGASGGHAPAFGPKQRILPMRDW